jgi:bacterioferritin
MYEKSIELLNTAIADEIAAIHQYMYFHFRLDDLGYAPLANLLKGEVEMTVGREVEKIHDAESMLKKAHTLEQEAIQMYNRFAMESAQNADSGTKKLFEDLVAAEEGHWDSFDRQSDHVKRFGEKYLALQSFQGEGEGGEGDAV